MNPGDVAYYQIPGLERTLPEPWTVTLVDHSEECVGKVWIQAENEHGQRRWFREQSLSPVQKRKTA